MESVFLIVLQGQPELAMPVFAKNNVKELLARVHSVNLSIPSLAIVCARSPRSGFWVNVKCLTLAMLMSTGVEHPVFA